ncbi:hypothetical protein JOB18_017176 [Solea senegalensis]|nr:uncharacterized protein LOC122771459 isoform X1 [Solea senegalensis]KAG7485741.1 GTPase IMAP family member 4 Immunity-associated nucleotide 1 [Solea senegalensis]KAG7485742.1 hypothetical protein JOB18_017176 [Solea senegalensis]
MSERFRGGLPGSSSPGLRLILLGNLGCGKTSSTDTILGQLSPISPTASRSCQLRQGITEGRDVTLVEAPRWYWNGGKMEKSVREETERAMTLVAPGPHAILLLVPVSQFTEMEGRVPAELEEVFGAESLDHTLVLLTCGDYLMGRTVEEYLQTEHPGLRQIIGRCGGRYHVINNRQRQDREQVHALLEKVDNMVQQNGVYHMKTTQERELDKQVSERRQEIMGSYRSQREEMRDVTSRRIVTTETQRSIVSGDEGGSTSVRRRQEIYDREGGVSVTQAANGLHSGPSPERQSYSELYDDRQVNRTPSFRLNADGAILSQMSDVASSPTSTKRVTTFHHRINSFEGRSPEASPTSPHLPVFSYPSSSPAFTPTSSSSFRSSYSTSKSTFAETSPSSPTSTSSYPSSYSTSSSAFAATSPSSPSSFPSSYSTSKSTFAETSPYSPTSTSSYPSSYSTSSSAFAATSPSSPSSFPSSYSTSKSTFAETSPSSPTSTSSYPSAYSTSKSTFSATSTSSPSSFPSSYSTSKSTFSANSSSSFPSSNSTSSSAFSATSPSSTSSFPSSYSTSSSTFASASPTLSSSFPSSPSLWSSSPELRLVLLGRSGAGKSAAGNAILGREEFKSHPDSLTAITQECQKKKALVEGRKVAVVDTPDWFNSELTPDEVRAQISSCVALSSPGPHAFLLCVPLDQPAKTEIQALRAIETVFGPAAVQNYTLVLFTYADKLRETGKAGNNSVEAYIANQRGDFLSLVEKCRDRFHVMENERGNVAELLDKVEQTVVEAGGQCYSSPAFQEAEDRVRQKQFEIAREKKGKKPEVGKVEDVVQLSSERRVLYPYMQTVAEAEEEVREDEIEKTRDEAEMRVSTMDIQSLPPITLSSISPSLFNTLREKIPKLMADGSFWVGERAKKVKGSPVWGNVGSGAQNIQKMVVDSSMWEKVGASARHASKLVGDRVPKVVVDSSAWVGSGAKAAAANPMWEKVGSGAKLMADRSVRVGAGIGSGAKNVAQSPMWGKVGSGAKTGAKLMADGSVRVGAGLGAGAKKVAQSPVWGKMGSGAKAGAKMVAESPVWEKMWNTAKKVPKVVIAGALLGLVLGVFLGGVIGGAVGAAAGSAATEVGRRKLANRNTSDKTIEAAKNLERKVNDSMDSLVKQGGKVLKTE